MKNKYFLIAVLAALSASACTREIVPEEAVTGTETAVGKVPMTFSVSYGEDKTETYLDGLSIKWNKDAISIIDGSTYSATSAKTAAMDPGTSNNRFTTTASGVSTAVFEGSASEAETYYAISPYVASTAMVSANVGGEPGGVPEKCHFYQIKDSASESLFLFMPGIQKPVAGSYDPNAHYLVGKTSDPASLSLKNVNGLLKFTLAGSDIKELVIYGNNKEYISGLMKVTFDASGNPVPGTVSSDLRSTFISVRPASGSTFAPGTYYVSVPPTVFSNGLRMELVNSEGKEAEKSGSSSLELKRAHVVNLGTIDSGVKWYETETASFLDFARQDVVGSPFKVAMYWPFSSPASNYFTSSTASGTMHNLERNELVLSSSGYKMYAYGMTYVTRVHDINGFRIGKGAGSYLELSGKTGKKIAKIRLVSGTSATYKITDTDDANPQMLEGGDAKGIGLGVRGFWTVTAEEGQSCRIAANSLAIWGVKVYFIDAGTVIPKNADASITRTATHQISDDGTKATFKGAFTMKTSAFVSDDVDFGFEWKQKDAADWTTVTVSEFTKFTRSSIDYYLYSAEVTGLPADKTVYYRAWVKGSGDTERIYGSQKTCYPSSQVITIDFSDALQAEDCLLSSLKTAGDATLYSGNKIYTMNFESGYDFAIYGRYGLGKSTSGGGLTVVGLCCSPYKATTGCDFGAGNTWIRIPARSGHPLEKITLSSISKLKMNLNLSSAVDPVTAEGNADICVNTYLDGTKSSATLVAAGTDDSTEYYLCIQPDNDVVNIVIGQIGIYYKQ